MPNFIQVAATAFAEWATAATISATGATSLAAAQAIYAVAYYGAEIGITAAVTAGLSAVARPSVPDAESGKITRRQSRPARCFAVGGPCRISAPFMESTL